MSPRRSTRAASAKPASKSIPKVTEKPAPRPRNHPNKKRAASPERTPSPPPKRSKTDESKSENVAPAPVRKPRSRTPSAKKPQTALPSAKKPRAKLTPVPEAAPAPLPQVKPYFNPLPTPPQKKRPALQLFAWGAGNFGQFGMGPDILGELDKPKKNMWVEQQIQAGAFGGDGAGLEAIAGGGMHSIFVDEKGTVSDLSTSMFSFSSCSKFI